jgi:hypothetical protein
MHSINLSVQGLGFVPNLSCASQRQARCRHRRAQHRFLTARYTIEERHEASGQRRVYERDQAQQRWRLVETRSEKTAPSQGLGRFDRLVQTLLLPADYPSSVSSDYDRFWRWNIARHTLLEAAEVLGTQSMLLALGVGGASTLPLAAAWKWVLKDGLGYFAKVALATQLAPRVDADPKRFRLFGDLVMALGTLFEMLTLSFPSWFLVLASVGNLLRKAADVATGPAYRVFLYHFSIRSNSGDVSSKSESQVVVGRLMGIGSGIAVSAATSNDATSLLVAYGVLSVGHLYATYQSVIRLELRTLNRVRLEYILTVYVDTQGASVPSIAEANAAERKQLLFPDKARYSIRFIDSLGELIGRSENDKQEANEPRNESSNEILTSIDESGSSNGTWERFLQNPNIRYVLARRFPDNLPNGVYLLALRDDATVVDILQALLHIWQSGGRDWPPPDPKPLLSRLQAAGWDTSRILWNTGSLRLSWDRATITESIA